MTVKLIRGDCLDAMSEIDAESIDAIVTDPPYGLEFMGAHWDGAVPGVDYWREALRVAKPGAHLLCFGGTRTFHRMACAIEDAGWEIRDCVMWVYGSGFPKSMDVSKAIDKAAGAEREIIGEHPNPAGNKAGGNSLNMSVVGMPEKSYITAPATEAAKRWKGYGTCLKPAWEPIIMARKPLDGTVAHNVLEYGAGALNIDGCRIGTEIITTQGGDKFPKVYDDFKTCEESQHAGRFPANLAHDGSDEVVRLFPNTEAGAFPAKSKVEQGGLYKGGWGKTDKQTRAKLDSGSAARFFYCAKASKSDRAEYNDHPTVKPNSLMRWLVRMICPKNGVVLDPFMGSGSTGVACIDESASFIGIEQDKHYLEIAQKRIDEAQTQLKFDFE